MKDISKLITIGANQGTKLCVIFVYGNIDIRLRHTISSFRLYEGAGFCVLIVVFFVCAIILYLIRRHAKLRRIDFIAGLLDVHGAVIGGGSIRCQHRWERMFFAVTLIASFFLVSLYLADFSMHSIINLEYQKVDTVEKLSAKNVKFYLDPSLLKHKSFIEYMLR